MQDVKVIRLGLGEVVSTWGTYEGLPAVFIEPVIVAPGAVGEKASDADVLDRSHVNAGGLILQIHKAAGADVVIEDLMAARERVAGTQETV